MSGLLARLRARIPLEEGSLVLITMIWGATFIIIRSALEATGPFFFVGVRFAFAALALILFSLPLLKDFTWREVWAGMSIGLCIFGGYALQTCGDAARQNSPGECVITSDTSSCIRCKKIAKAGQVPAFLVSPVVVWGMAGLACAGA